jgi:molybdopterin synthase sulfur carrier subunit
MQIQLKFFASLREALGTGSESISLPAGVHTVAQVREFLQARGGVWAEALAEGQVMRFACNQEMVAATAQLSEGCELAFFPPVTGG